MTQEERIAALEDTLSRALNLIGSLQKMTRFNAMVLQDIIQSLTANGIPPVTDLSRLARIQELANEIVADTVEKEVH